MERIIYKDGSFSTYEYENNPSLLNASFPKDVIKLGWGGCSVNNPLKIHKNGKTVTFSYVYNEYGYPKIITVNDGTSITTKNLTYETY